MEVIIAENSHDKNDCFKLREVVFVNEQNVPIEIEMDEFDNTAVHFLLLEDSNPVATGRVINEGSTASIGRVAVLKEHRGKGTGAFLMKEMIAHCKKQGFKKVVLGAQEYAIGFYEKLHFEVCSDRYMDANIPHFKMQLILND